MNQLRTSRQGIAYYNRPTGTPIVTVRVVVNAGSAHEKVPGTAHFLEHMFFKGSQKRGYEEMNRILAALGDTNAYTTTDRTVFYVNTTDDINVQKALDLLLEMLFLPALAPVEVEKERQVILEEYQSGMDNPMHYFVNEAGSFIFDGPNGRSVIGTKESIKDITLADLHAYRNANYTRQNLAITIIGGNQEVGLDSVEALLDKYADHLIDGVENTIQIGPKRMGTWQNPKCLNVTHDAEQAGVILWMPCVTTEEEHALKLAPTVMENMLGQGMHSMLFQKLREESGLCYSTGAFSSGVWEDQVFGAYALLSPENVAQAQTEMAEIIRDLAAGEFDDDLMLTARSNALFSLSSATETASGWAMAYSDRFFFYRHKGLLALMEGGINAERGTILSMTPDELRKNITNAAQRLLTGAAFVTMNAP